jgi:hypothetical protein
MFPSESDLTICFAHVAYQLQQRFALRKLPIRNFGVTSHDELDARIGEADVLVISGLWHNELTSRAPKLRFIQSQGRICRAHSADVGPLLSQYDAQKRHRTLCIQCATAISLWERSMPNR